MKSSELKALVPIVFLIVASLVLNFFGEHVFGGRLLTIAHHAEHVVAGFGYLGYVLVVVAYALCCFFFVPLLIPLNVASGALYGPYIGTVVAVASITAGSTASAVSIRYVFTGFRGFFERRAGANRLLQQAGSHGALSVLLLRLAFIVPYMWQNIFLALAPIRLGRLVLLTAVGCIPGAAIYSLLGAGLMNQDHTGVLAAYLGVPLLLFIVVTVVTRQLKKHYGADETSADENVAEGNEQSPDGQSLD